MLATVQDGVTAVPLLIVAAVAVFVRAPPHLAAAEPFTYSVEVGEKEVAFDSSRDGCALLDIPDEPLRAFRRSDGALVGIASHSTTRIFLIATDGTFTRDCRPALESALDPDPEAFRYKTWIGATWTDDGERIVALADNEFRGNEIAGECPYATYYQCWYNAVVLVQSDDGGRTFTVATETRPVASATFGNQAHPGIPRGFFGPSNIVARDDGYRYAVIYTTGGGDQPAGTCLFRSSAVADSDAWQYWTGQAFVPSTYDPYHDTSGRPPCRPIAGLPGRVSSIVEYGGGFIATFAAQGADEAIGKIGVTYSTDLLHWTDYEVILTPQMIWSKTCGEPRYAYPSIVDLTSQDRNFGVIGDAPYLYLTEAAVERCAMTTDRNLVRYPLVFRK